MNELFDGRYEAVKLVIEVDQELSLELSTYKVAECDGYPLQTWVLDSLSVDELTIFLLNREERSVELLWWNAKLTSLRVDDQNFFLDFVKNLCQEINGSIRNDYWCSERVISSDCLFNDCLSCHSD